MFRQEDALHDGDGRHDVYLGSSGLRPTVIAMLLGPASSSCSFAALSAGRALLAKGAALVPMMAFLFGATNLGPPVIALAWIFLGWQFALALPVGAVFLVTIMALIVWLTCPKQLLERARADARTAVTSTPACMAIRRKGCRAASETTW